MKIHPNQLPHRITEAIRAREKIFKRQRRFDSFFDKVNQALQDQSAVSTAALPPVSHCPENSAKEPYRALLKNVQSLEELRQIEPSAHEEINTIQNEEIKTVADLESKIRRMRLRRLLGCCWLIIGVLFLLLLGSCL